MKKFGKTPLIKLLLFVVDKKGSTTGSESSSTSISTAAIREILERLKQERHQDSTRKTYYGIWKTFNQFYLKLDKKPCNWEDLIILFAGHLIAINRKSAKVKSYVSAIKAMLLNIGIEVNEDRVLLSAITRAGKLKHNHSKLKLPIKKGVLNVLVGSVNKLFDAPQPYLELLYKTMISTAYFGLFRVGEITRSKHSVKACDVHIGSNKRKLLFVL